MSSHIDTGPFDLITTCKCVPEWLEETDDPVVEACRQQFAAHLDKLARQFQIVMAHKIRVALKQSHQCIEDTDFNSMYDKGGKDGVPDLNS